MQLLQLRRTEGLTESCWPSYEFIETSNMKARG